MKLTVDRAEWMTGSGSQLYNSKHDCGCILGHYMLAQGIDKKLLDNESDPTTVLEENGWEAHDLVEQHLDIIVEEDGYLLDDPELVDDQQVSFKNTELAKCAMEINDTMIKSLPQKEEELTQIFRDFDVDLQFTGSHMA